MAIWMLFPLVFSLGRGQVLTQQAFAISIIFAVFIGTTILLVTNRRKISLGKRDIALLLPLIAMTATFLGGLPLYLTGSFHSIFNASFESLSGLTTTGLSLHPDPSIFSQSELLWRAMLQWLGGFSTLILVIWALPYLGLGGPVSFEGHNPEDHNYSPHLSLKKTLTTLLIVYLVISALCVLSLLFSGLSLFESICYAMSTVSTGGFFIVEGGPLSHDSSIVKLILAVFMLLGAMNFSLHGKFMSGSLKIYAQDSETRTLLVFLLLSVALGIVVVDPGSGGLIHVSEVVLQLISVITTTGYPSSQSSSLLPNFYVLMLLILALLGGCAGSTSGGFKVIRIGLLLQQAKQEFFHLTHPHSVVPIKYGSLSISSDTVKILSVFAASYLGILAFLTIVLSLFDISFSGSIALAIATLTNSGPNIIEVSGQSYNLQLLPWIAKLGLMMGMLIGRLEILGILVLFNYSFWRN